jgi:dienelactone hydrolase
LARERGETPKAASETIEGYLSKPEGNGPFAAIVYLHGCDGLSEDARTYNARGNVSLMLDSFATRGIKNACSQVTQGLLLTRQGDALGALSYLSNLPFVDPQRIAASGSAASLAFAMCWKAASARSENGSASPGKPSKMVTPRASRAD